MSYWASGSIKDSLHFFIQTIPSVEYFFIKKMQLKVISTLVFVSLAAAVALPVPSGGEFIPVFKKLPPPPKTYDVIPSPLPRSLRQVSDFDPFKLPPKEGLPPFKDLPPPKGILPPNMTDFPPHKTDAPTSANKDKTHVPRADADPLPPNKDVPPFKGLPPPPFKGLPPPPFKGLPPPPNNKTDLPPPPKATHLPTGGTPVFHPANTDNHSPGQDKTNVHLPRADVKVNLPPKKLEDLPPPLPKEGFPPLPKTDLPPPKTKLPPPPAYTPVSPPVKDFKI
jgi:hypothetical protein